MELGRGSFGSVRGVGTDAIKSFKNEVHGLSYLINEAFVTRFVSIEELPNVIRLKGCNFDELTMTTERWHCNLDTAMKRGLSLDQKRAIHRCVLRGLAYLGRVYIINADIKPSNILVNAKCTEACIADFGISSSSGAAKVRLTSPAYSLPRTKVKNHRTHDLYSFVVLTLNLFYGYRFSSRLVQSNAELRSEVDSLTPQGAMRATLNALVRDDRLSCWTAERALYELYNERLPEMKRRATVWDGKNVVVWNSIENNVDMLNARYDFRRRRECTRCTYLLVASLGLANLNECVAYSTVMAFVFTCAFGTRERMAREERMSDQDVRTLVGINASRLCSYLNTIICNKDVMRLMFLP